MEARIHLTCTKVPKFAGVNSWEQYRQVFDAIAWSNGWDDATATLHLLSHLESDALNVALVPEAKRATWTGLVGAHYGSPGRLYTEDGATGVILVLVTVIRSPVLCRN